jgi:hypothetical protein
MNYKNYISNTVNNFLFRAKKKLLDKMHVVYTHMELIVHDADGKIVSRRLQLCKSLNENFLSMLYYSINYNVGNPPAGYGFTAPHLSAQSFFDYNATERRSIPIGMCWNCGGTAADNRSGLVVGIGAPNVAPLQRSLANKCAHGNGANQMMYAAQSCANGVQVAAQVSSMVFNRTFQNAGGAAIQISEVGFESYDTGDNWHFLLLIDAVTPNQVVNPTQSLSINLTFQVTT